MTGDGLPPQPQPAASPCPCSGCDDRRRLGAYRAWFEAIATCGVIIPGGETNLAEVAAWDKLVELGELAPTAQELRHLLNPKEKP